MSKIITPQQFRNTPVIGNPLAGAGQVGQMPSIDEIVDSFIEGLTAASQKDLKELPALKIYGKLYEELVSAGMTERLASETIAKIKVGAPEAFVNHPKFEQFMKLFAGMVYKLYAAIEDMIDKADNIHGTTFESDPDALFLSMVADRFALIIPAE